MKLFACIAGMCLAVIAFSCNTAKQAGGSGCKYDGVVMDMRGLDGCGLMIVLNDSTHTRLQPVEIADTSFHLQPGQRVLVNYTELTGRMSTCMSGKIVRIDCIKGN
jgi:hypothetical protein